MKWRISLLLIPIAILTGCSSALQAGDSHPPLAVKILVEESGLYQIDVQDLEAFGWNLEQVDFDRIYLLYRGQERPFWVEDEAGGLKIRFYAQNTDSRYTRLNVYWLADQSYLREFAPSSDDRQGAISDEISIDSFTAVGPARTNTYIASLLLEENLVYTPQVEDFDPWFWLSMPAPISREFEFELSQVASGTGRVWVEVWATTQASQSPDHHLRLTLNGQPLADKFWDGKGLKIIQAEVPEGMFRSGLNNLEIDSPGDTGVAADIVLLNRIAFTYPRYTIAREDRLTFIGSGEKMVLSGFSGPVKGYDITDPEGVLPLQLQAIDNSTIEVQTGLDRRYLIVGPMGFLKPYALKVPFLSPQISATDRGGDYLAIGPRELLEPLQPLLDYRASQGFEVFAITDTAVYDQFNHGFPEPEAIRNFLRYAAENWQLRPRYVLLVGDSTYDPKGFLGQSNANQLPVYLVDTVYGGETASDVIFTRLDEDALPDIALGRIPAQTPRQVETWVQKLLAYERASPVGEWNQRILAVADGQERSFQKDAQGFLDRFPDGFQKSLINPTAGAAGVNAEIVQSIESGNLLVAYFGHGSVEMWGKDRLFSTQDVAVLSNQDHYPLVLNMTCLTGLFTHPKVESLAETLLWHQNGGAVAVLAPTSLTLPTDQSFLSEALVDALIADPDQAIGDVLLAARRGIPADNAGTRDVMETFLLFGDPAMKLIMP